MDPTEDGCGRQLSPCHCFRDCIDITDKDFQKIVELEDAGVALYRYVPPNLDPTQNIGEVYILRTDDDVELEPDEFTMTFAKNKISCPRCIKLIEKAEKLFNDLPSVKQQDVAGVCDHCWKPVAKMQRLAELARRERDVRDPAAVDALKAQMLQAMGTEDVKKRFKEPRQLRPTTPKGPRRQMAKILEDKDIKSEPPIEKEESLMSYELKSSAKDGRDKAHGDKSEDERPRAKEEKSKGKEEKSKEKQGKLEEKEDKEKEAKTKSKDEKVKGKEEKSKTQEEKSKDKVDKSKDKEGKSKDIEEKEKRLPRKTMSGDELKQQLAQIAKEKQEAEQKRKQQQQEKEMAERKIKEAERLKEIEREKNKEAKLKPPKLHAVTDDDDDDDIHVHTVYKAPATKDIIIGENICKSRRTEKNEELQELAKAGKEKTQKTIQAGKIPTVDSEKQNKIHETDKTKGEKINKNRPEQNDTKEQSQQETKKSGEEPNKTSKSTSETSGTTKSAAVGKQKIPYTNTKTDDGIIRYALSDRTFIDKGWTMLPLEKVVRKMNVYRMRPAHPEFDWFEHNKKRRLLEYDSGEKLAEIDDTGRGRWYYRSGKLAMDYYDAEETNARQRFVVYSTGTPDERGRPRPRTVLATFDYLGNGIVFDHTGKIRLKYNQTEGVVLDRELGPVSHWKWHTLNDPPVLQQVMIDTQMSHKDPTIMSMGDPRADAPRQDDDAMLAIEFDNFVKEKTKKSSQNFKPFQIKMKALKINEYFSLRVMDQASVYLSFRDGSANLKINIGMVLDHKEIVDTDTAEIGEVSNKVDKLPACTNSIGDLQKAVAHARAAEGLRALRERQLRGPAQAQCASRDFMRAAASRPPRTPLACSVTSHIKTPSNHKPPCSCDCYCYNNPLF